MSQEVLEEELEVLESIYPTELTKLSEREIQIQVEPEESVDGGEDIKLLLKLVYPGSYPDALPDISLETFECELEKDEVDSLLDQLRSVGSENLGMAMTFTLVSHLREQLLALAKTRIQRGELEAKEKERLALEAEEARTRGTPVTVESFKVWKIRFTKEMNERKAREEEEKLKALSPKEREERRKISSRLTGRQLFEHDRNLDMSDLTLVEEGAIAVDASQYERIKDQREDDEEERLRFSDSD